MFKILGNLPNTNASVRELADYIEYECIRNDSASIQRVLQPLLLSNDEALNNGITDETDQFNSKIESVSAEIDRRIKATNGRYPFELKNLGYSLEIKNKDNIYWVYTYLLFSTRLKMSPAPKGNKVINGIDGTTLLERLSALIAKEYFGDRSESLVFGTAEAGTFEAKINDLCSRLGEGIRFDNKNDTTPDAQDDKLDVVVWKNFVDNKHSKIIGFGQCKTGTSWTDVSTIEMQPNVFCKKWFRRSPIHDPIKMFFCSLYFPIEDYTKAINAGVVFDRMRIIDYLPSSVESDLMDDIKKWCSGAISLVKK